MVKIAISGKARSGKNTLAEIICSELENLYQDKAPIITAFADPIKKIAKNMFPDIDYQDLWGPSERRDAIIPSAFNADGTPLTVRKLLLDIGKTGRVYNPNIWINATFSEVERCQKYIPIISDCRFANEFEALKNNNYFLIRIKRPQCDYVVKDISEIDLDNLPDSKFDYVILNDSSLDVLKQKIVNLIECLKTIK